MSQRVYLDYNASAPLRPEVREAMVEALAIDGNPSSVHAEGRAARAAIEAAREKVAFLVGAVPANVIFTSGGTESNATALAPKTAADPLFVSAIEHPSVLAGGRFPANAVRQIPVTGNGVIDLEILAGELDTHHFEGERARALVSVMTANNETGAIQPVSEAAAIVHERGGVLHSDAVQAAGKLKLDLAALGADLLTLSAHKMGGPKGVGALVLRRGMEVGPLLQGGSQEQRRRAGTENVACIVGFGVAAELAVADLEKVQAVAKLRDELEAGASAVTPDAVVFSAAVPRLPNTICLAVPGTKAETLVIGLDLAGLAVSSGSACSSGKVEASHVLSAMGVTQEIAQGAIRVSLGWATEAEHVERFIEAWGALIKRLKEARQAA